MSLPSLLRHIGVHIPRGVDVDGRILTGRAAGAAVATGAATAVAKHEFHGGAAPALADAAAPSGPHARAWWNTDPVARDADIAAVAAAFPGFTYDAADGGHRFEGVINTGRGRFRVSVVGNPRGGLPRLVPVHPRTLGRHEGRGFRRSEHLYDNGNLCVAAAEDWDPEEHNTVTCIAWAAHWYAVYTDWRLGGPWPTDGYRPDVAQ